MNMFYRVIVDNLIILVFGLEQSQSDPLRSLRKNYHEKFIVALVDRKWYIDGLPTLERFFWLNSFVRLASSAISCSIT